MQWLIFVSFRILLLALRDKGEFSRFRKFQSSSSVCDTYILGAVCWLVRTKKGLQLCLELVIGLLEVEEIIGVQGGVCV